MWQMIKKTFSSIRLAHTIHPESDLRLVERLSLGPKKMLYLVHCKGHDLVVATGGDSIVSILEIGSAEVAAKTSLSSVQKESRVS